MKNLAKHLTFKIMLSTIRYLLIISISTAAWLMPSVTTSLNTLPLSPDTTHGLWDIKKALANHCHSLGAQAILAETIMQPISQKENLEGRQVVIKYFREHQQALAALAILNTITPTLQSENDTFILRSLESSLGDSLTLEELKYLGLESITKKELNNHPFWDNFLYSCNHSWIIKALAYQPIFYALFGGAALYCTGLPQAAAKFLTNLGTKDILRASYNQLLPIGVFKPLIAAGALAIGHKTYQQKMLGESNNPNPNKVNLEFIKQYQLLISRYNALKYIFEQQIIKNNQKYINIADFTTLETTITKLTEIIEKFNKTLNTQNNQNLISKLLPQKELFDTIALKKELFDSKDDILNLLQSILTIDAYYSIAQEINTWEEKSRNELPAINISPVTITESNIEIQLQNPISPLWFLQDKNHHMPLMETDMPLVKALQQLLAQTIGFVCAQSGTVTPLPIALTHNNTQQQSINNYPSEGYFDAGVQEIEKNKNTLKAFYANYNLPFNQHEQNPNTEFYKIFMTNNDQQYFSEELQKLLQECMKWCNPENHASMEKVLMPINNQMVLTTRQEALRTFLPQATPINTEIQKILQQVVTTGSKLAQEGKEFSLNTKIIENTPLIFRAHQPPQQGRIGFFEQCGPSIAEGTHNCITWLEKITSKEPSTESLLEILKTYNNLPLFIEELIKNNRPFIETLLWVSIDTKKMTIDDFCNLWQINKLNKKQSFNNFINDLIKQLEQSVSTVKELTENEDNEKREEITKITLSQQQQEQLTKIISLNKQQQEDLFSQQKQVQLINMLLSQQEACEKILFNDYQQEELARILLDPQQQNALTKILSLNSQLKKYCTIILLLNVRQKEEFGNNLKKQTQEKLVKFNAIRPTLQKINTIQSNIVNTIDIFEKYFLIFVEGYATYIKNSIFYGDTKTTAFKKAAIEIAKPIIKTTIEGLYYKTFIKEVIIPALKEFQKESTKDDIPDFEHITLETQDKLLILLKTKLQEAFSANNNLNNVAATLRDMTNPLNSTFSTIFSKLVPGKVPNINNMNGISLIVRILKLIRHPIQEINTLLQQLDHKALATFLGNYCLALKDNNPNSMEPDNVFKETQQVQEVLKMPLSTLLADVAQQKFGTNKNLEKLIISALHLITNIGNKQDSNTTIQSLSKPLQIMAEDAKQMILTALEIAVDVDHSEKITVQEFIDTYLIGNTTALFKNWTMDSESCWDEHSPFFNQKLELSRKFIIHLEHFCADNLLAITDEYLSQQPGGGLLKQLIQALIRSGEVYLQFEHLKTNYVNNVRDKIIENMPGIKTVGFNTILEKVPMIEETTGVSRAYQPVSFWSKPPILRLYDTGVDLFDFCTNFSPFSLLTPINTTIQVGKQCYKNVINHQLIGTLYDAIEATRSLREAKSLPGAIKEILVGQFDALQKLSIFSTEKGKKLIETLAWLKTSKVLYFISDFNLEEALDTYRNDINTIIQIACILEPYYALAQVFTYNVPQTQGYVAVELDGKYNKNNNPLCLQATNLLMPSCIDANQTPVSITINSQHRAALLANNQHALRTIEFNTYLALCCGYCFASKTGAKMKLTIPDIILAPHIDQETLKKLGYDSTTAELLEYKQAQLFLEKYIKQSDRSVLLFMNNPLEQTMFSKDLITQKLIEPNNQQKAQLNILRTIQEMPNVCVVMNTNTLKQENISTITNTLPTFALGI
jgi:hypothetical protein